MMKNLANQEMNIDYMAASLYTSRSRLFKKVNELTGMSPQRYFMEFRLMKALELLSEEKYSITDISEMTGFANSSHFSTKFKKRFGTSPSKWRKIDHISETTE